MKQRETLRSNTWFRWSTGWSFQTKKSNGNINSYIRSQFTNTIHSPVALLIDIIHYNYLHKSMWSNNLSYSGRYVFIGWSIGSCDNISTRCSGIMLVGWMIYPGLFKLGETVKSDHCANEQSPTGMCGNARFVEMTNRSCQAGVM